MTPGERLARLRNERELPQDALAEMIGVSRQSPAVCPGSADADAWKERNGKKQGNVSKQRRPLNIKKAKMTAAGSMERVGCRRIMSL